VGSECAAASYLHYATVLLLLLLLVWMHNDNTTSNYHTCDWHITQSVIASQTCRGDIAAAAIVLPLPVLPAFSNVRFDTAEKSENSFVRPTVTALIGVVTPSGGMNGIV
jgi:hypothetical protein